MTKFTILLFGSLTFLNFGTAHAQGKARWGAAGCGFGSVAIDRNEQLPQIGAWFLNTILGNQTFAISSGTSNCVESRNETAAVEQEVFLRANFAALNHEAVQGGGEHIEALADVFGCRQPESTTAIKSLSQNRYDAIFSSQDPDVVLTNYLREIRTDEALVKDCTRV